MAVVTSLLRRELMEGFFEDIKSIRAIVEYTRNGIKSTGTAENVLQGWTMSIKEDASATDVVAEFVNPLKTSNFIIIDLLQNSLQQDSAEVKKLQFTNNSGDTTYFEWIFSTGEVVYTGNGELHIEEVNFKVV
jgi:hypothetical protein